MDGKGLFNINN